MVSQKRSNKWAFLIYEDSVVKNYLDALNNMHVPWILSPWHDRDVDKKTGEIKKAHRHGALFFDSFKSYSQVSELISEKLNAPKLVEIIMSPTGMYDYFIHADNPDKTQYDIVDIESGCGFDLPSFLLEQDSNSFLAEIIDLIEENDFTEFQDFVSFARQNNPLLLSLIMNKTYFFAKLLDSRRYKSERNRHNKGGVSDE